MRKQLARSILLFMGLLLGPALWAQAVDEWPMTIERGGVTLTIYQPQPESYVDNHLSGRAAISVQSVDSEERVFGAVWFEARVVCDRLDRLCSFEDIRVPTIRFPEDQSTPGKISRYQDILESEIPMLDYTISMDRLLASIELAEERSELDREFNHDPPEIIVTQEPSILVIIDGDPKLTPLEEDDDFLRVANTPFFIVQYRSNERYYLYGDGQWYVSEEVLHGWRPDDNPPRKVDKLTKDLVKENKKADEPIYSDDLLRPEGTVDEDDAPVLPQIIVRTQPAELLQSDGAPEFASIENTDLLYMSNTEDLVFMDIQSQQYYVVLSGRWYRSKAVEGPWSYVPSDELPEDFADIPPGSERDMALAYVAGTEEAREAVVDAYIPETATVDRQRATTEVEYDGPPRFEPIPGTRMEYAVNTAGTVLRYEGRYYCVDGGIWFESDFARGPWRVSIERPAEVDRIPPRSPVYRVKYVYIYDYTPSVVYVGYTPGYTGSYVFGPTVVYGTGWYYDPWYGSIFIPRHWTWGFHMNYHPWHGWSVGWSVVWGRPSGWYRPWFYYPSYYHYRPPFYGAWWGPVYYRPPVYYPAPRTSYYGPRAEVSRTGPATSQPRPSPRASNLYALRRDRAVRADEVPPRTSVSRTRTQERTLPEQERRRNDIYTDREGNIYRRGREGEWERLERDRWRSVPRSRETTRPPEETRRQPRTSPSQLERYKNQRQRGTQRTENYRRYQQQSPQKQKATKKKGRTKRSGGG